MLDMLVLIRNDYLYFFEYRKHSINQYSSPPEGKTIHLHCKEKIKIVNLFTCRYEGATNVYKGATLCYEDATFSCLRENQ